VHIPAASLFSPFFPFFSSLLSGDSFEHVHTVSISQVCKLTQNGVQCLADVFGCLLFSDLPCMMYIAPVVMQFDWPTGWIIRSWLYVKNMSDIFMKLKTCDSCN
jgi:hypothetical protein